MNSNNEEASADTSQLQVLNYQAVCVEQDQRLCLLVKDKQMEDWGYHYGIIKGFDYEWGYDYVIEVVPLEMEEEEDMADYAGGDLQYVKTISKTKVSPDYTFKILLKDKGIESLRRRENNTYFLYDDIAVNVARVDTAQLEDLATTALTALGVFKHSPEKNEIILTTINFEENDK